MARSRRQQIRMAGARGRGGGRNRGRAVGRFLRLRTGRQAGRIANAQAGSEFNAEIRNARSQARGSRKRARDAGAWFNELAGDYAQAQEQGNAAYKTQQDAVSRQLAEASERTKGEQQGISKRDADFAKLVGGPIDTQGAARMAAAAAASDRSRVTLSQLPAAEQANFLASLGSQRTAARLQGIETRRSENRRRDKILNDLAGIRKEKGQARVVHKEKIREADRAERHARVADRQAGRQISQEAQSNEAYNNAIIEQARLGLAGRQASAGAQIGAAQTYAGADRRTATATERAARAAERGRKATARSQKAVAKTYGKGGSGGYNSREAQALLSSAGKNFKNPQAAVNYLVNRGVKLAAARAAVKAAVGGKRKSGSRRGSTRGRRRGTVKGAGIRRVGRG